METDGKPERRYDIDWLRCIAMLVVFFFHSARFFDSDGWHIKNAELSFGMDIFIMLVGVWMMPIFFVISGEGTYFALRFRKSGEYIRERFKRLFIPLIFGIFILSPHQIYLERLTHSQFVGSFVDFLPHYFNGPYLGGGDDPGNFAWMGVHLWFLLFLFIFSLATVRLFLYWKKDVPKERISKMASFFKIPGTIFLLALPVCLLEIALGPDIGMKGFGGWSIFIYPIFFIYGYLLASDEKFREALERNRWIGVALVLVIIVWGVLGQSGILQWGDIQDSFARAFLSIAWIVLILGFGSKHLNFNRKILKYANEAVLPFYILHQAIILIVGFYVVQWSAGIGVKYLVIVVVSFALIMVIYEFAVRRVNVLRFLFGMRAKKG